MSTLLDFYGLSSDDQNRVLLMIDGLKFRGELCLKHIN